MARRVLAFVLVSTVLIACVSAQELPRLAVIPLNPIGVSKSDAAAFTALLETALVQTGMFGVLEQSQTSLVLEAQERSLADCTDESCAIEFGKLLAAEQILLGSISVVGEKYLLTAKIIDVTTGKNLKADTVSAQGITALTDEVELLGFKLAGLTQRTGGEEKIARAFAEVFVETDPDAAEVSLNGVPKGKSPILLDRVPVGSVTIEARKDNLFASRDIQVGASGLNQVQMKLEISVGNIFVKTSAREGMHLFIDGVDMGLLGRGLFEKIPSGERQIVLRGGGYFWEGSAAIETGRSITVEAFPQEVGAVQYSISAGASAELVAPTYRRVLRGSGTLENVPAGSYSVTVSGEDYETATLRLAVSRAATARLAPEMRMTELGARRALERQLAADLDARQAALAAGRRLSAADTEALKAVQERALGAGFADLASRAASLAQQTSSGLELQQENDARAAFQTRLDAVAQRVTSGQPLGAADAEEARKLATELSSSTHSFPDLKARGEALAPVVTTLADLEARRSALQTRLSQVPARAKARSGIVGLPLVLLGIGSVAAGAALYGVVGLPAYREYEAATSTIDAAVARKKVELHSTITCGCAGGFAASITLGIMAGGWQGRQTRRIQRDLNRVAEQIAKARMEVK